MLTCQELTERVTDYLEGRLSWPRRLGLLMHLKLCRPCGHYGAQLRATRRTLRELGGGPPSDLVRDRLLADFDRLCAGEEHHEKPRVSRTLRALAALQCLLRGRRAIGAVALLVLAMSALALAIGQTAGEWGTGGSCLLSELVVAAALAGTLGGIARLHRVHLSGGLYATAATLGAAIAALFLQWSCPWAGSLPHLVTFHLGGLVFAAMAAPLANRLLVWG